MGGGRRSTTSPRTKKCLSDGKACAGIRGTSPSERGTGKHRGGESALERRPVRGCRDASHRRVQRRGNQAAIDAVARCLLRFLPGPLNARMVDIHSHIVYGVDDGAQTIEDSLAMLEIAADAGTTDIVATPHSDLRFHYDPDLVAGRIAEMQALIGDRIRIHRGCDFHLFFDNIENCRTDRSPFTINGRSE